MAEQRDAVAETVPRVAHDESLRQLGAQQAWISDIRARANVLLGAGVIAASFFGLKAHLHDGGLVMGAIVGFVVLAIAVTVLLAPTGRWGFFTDGDDYKKQVASPSVKLDELLFTMAKENSEHVAHNKELLDRSNRVLVCACFGLGIEVVFLMCTLRR